MIFRFTQVVAVRYSSTSLVTSSDTPIIVIQIVRTALPLIVLLVIGLPSRNDSRLPLRTQLRL